LPDTTKKFTHNFNFLICFIFRIVMKHLQAMFQMMNNNNNNNNNKRMVSYLTRIQLFICLMMINYRLFINWNNDTVH